MARSRPHVKDDLLSLSDELSAPIVLDSPAWYAWLERHSGFAFADSSGAITVRKERGGYWKAYRRSGDKLRTAYLGRTADMTGARLRTAAQSLAGTAPPAPAQSPQHATTAAPEPAGQTRVDALLHTKFFIPPPRPQRVIRTHLLARLRAEPLPPVVLVAGPPGYGKTTLIADWIAGDARTAAWLALDAGDNDPVRFWTAVALALDSLQPGVVARALDLVRAPGSPSVATILAAVLNDLAMRLVFDHAERPALLVLDDYHVIEQLAIHDTVLTLVERLPPQIRLVIASRADPPLRLGRLRVRAQLLEIRMADLAFTTAETAAFLSDTMGLALSEAAAATLAERTEGWAAALQLAALSLRSQPDPAAFIATFGGRHQLLLAYLVDEVFGRQPPAVQDFLLATSVLERMCAELCDAMLQRTETGCPLGEPRTDERDKGSQAMLETLESANLFVVSLDTVGHWYRYHQLFAEMVRYRLRRMNPALEPELRRRASAWYEQAGYANEAITQALTGQDWDRAARLIEQFGELVWRRGQHLTIESWLHALPALLVAQRPNLGLLQALRYISKLQYTAAEALLDTIERSLVQVEADITGPSQTGTPSAATAIRARAAILQAHITRMLRGDIVESVALAHSALDRLPPDDTHWRSYVTGHLAAVDYDRGNMDAAQQQYMAAIALAQRINNFAWIFFLHFGYGTTLIDMGRLQEAQARCDEMYQLAIGWSVHDAPTSSFIDCLSAMLRYEANDLAEAERLARRTIDMVCHGQNPLGHWYICLLLSWIRLAQGDPAAALQVLDTAESLLEPSTAPNQTGPPLLHLALGAWRAQVVLARHECGVASAATGVGTESVLATIARWAELPAAPDRPAHVPVAQWIFRAVQLVPAHARMLRGDYVGALAHLERLCVDTEAIGAHGLLIPVLALEAIVLEQLGRRAAARAALLRALTLGAQQGHVRSIIDAGPKIAPLLRAVAQELQRNPGASTALLAYVGRLCDAAAPLEVSVALHQSDESPTPDMLDGTLEAPLTSRELAILRLLAAGRSNQEIADQLIIAVSTVKWHLRLIYNKLGAANRTEAAARARALGIIR